MSQRQRLFINGPERLRRGAWTLILLALVLALMLVSGRAPGVALGAVPNVTPEPSAAVVEERVRHLAERLRCLVCQNQTLADSNADLAADLREKIREQVRQGATDVQIEAYMVQRYGDFVLYQPPLKPATWMLWFGPFIALGLGACILWRALRRHRAAVAALPTLDDDAHQRAAKLLETFDQDSRR
ncbi:cytochrome c-type biogenesis protein [Paraburkholderia hayleyella]|uniref:cytochrome c-type biogenesis protein n=1 Tax=Paraburkholderia hayleyella TaxID=2152889 RepID=UPI001FE32D07|nr:cytochrome c-type biogenesis protein [Paraburkholderia hayleyella]